MYKVEPKLHHILGTEKLREFLKACCLCNRANFDPETLFLPIHQRKIIGDPSDSAILRFAEEYSTYVRHFILTETYRVTHYRSLYHKLTEIPFNSKNKWMLNIFEHPTDGTSVLYMKGAAEMMLDRCTTIWAGDSTQILDNELKETIIDQQVKPTSLFIEFY